MVARSKRFQTTDRSYSRLDEKAHLDRILDEEFEATDKPRLTAEKAPITPAVPESRFSTRPGEAMHSVPLDSPAHRSSTDLRSPSPSARDSAREPQNQGLLARIRAKLKTWLGS